MSADQTVKYVYSFGGDRSEGNGSMRALLGGKGANLAEMASLGLPVPPGFTISTEACAEFGKIGKDALWLKIEPEVRAALAQLEKTTGKTFGRGPHPLLVSVRSGAAASMPGMMDTVLNLGMNDETAKAMIELTGNRRFVLDSFRRFMQMFGDVVMHIDSNLFEGQLEALKKARGVKLDYELSADDLEELIKAYKEIVRAATGDEFPTDPMDQLRRGIRAVFESWDNPRAIVYRQINDIRGLIGTAVNVQTMVFGNSGDNSATGVAFTRDPATGEHAYFYGEFLVNAQGEDVVAGIRTPQQITVAGSRVWAERQGISEEERRAKYPALEEVMPECFRQLDAIRNKLEKHYRDMQDMEFTIENGKLYMLQTRNGKRTAAAAVKIAIDLIEEGLISEKEAVLRVDPTQLDQLLHPVFDPKAEKAARKLTVGLPASPGACSGQVVFSAADAERWNAAGKAVVLCRMETSPEDITGMTVSRGILTARGGVTSHAAVVARGMGACCVAGASEVEIDYAAHLMMVNGVVVKEGDWISLNGSTGAVYAGTIAVVAPTLSGPFAAIMKLADKYRRLGVRTNADTPADTATAVRFGAEGIGLCRTEHMFFEGNRVVAFRRLILVAETVKKLKEKYACEDVRKLAELCEGLAAKAKAAAARCAAAAERAAAATECDDDTVQAAVCNAVKTVAEDAALAVATEANEVKQYMAALEALLPLQRGDFEGMFKALEGRPCIVRLLDPPLHEFLPQNDNHKAQREMAEQLGMTVENIQAVVASLHEVNPMLGHRGCRLGITYPEVTYMQARAIAEAAAAVPGSKPEIMVPLVGNVKELALQKKIIRKAIAAVEAEKNVKLDIQIGTMIEVPRAAVTADKIAEEAEFFSFGTNDLTQMGCGFSRDDAARYLGHYVKLGIYDYDPFRVLDQSGVGELVKLAVAKGRATRPEIKLGICGEHGGDPATIAFCDKVGLNYVSCSPYRVPVARLAAAQAAIKAEQA